MESIQASIQNKIDELTKKTAQEAQRHELNDAFKGILQTLDELIALQEQLLIAKHKRKKAKESETKPKKDDTLHNFAQFKKWLLANEVPWNSGIDFGINLPEGNALIATKDIAQNEQILRVPVRMMLTARNGLEMTSELHKLLDEELVKLVPGLGLALRLLYEKNKLNSFWTPYIKILPEKYSIPLYFTYDEIAPLKGSLALTDTVKFVKSKIREYAFMYNIIKNQKGHILNEFTFTWNEFRWATSVVTTRQNFLPIDGQTALVLIPFWDLANHAQGKVSTYYDEQSRELECFAHTNFKKGDQVTIFYGVRPNYELFLYSGFVYDNNQHDAVRMKLDIPANTDSSYDLRAAKMDILKNIDLVKASSVDETVLPKNPGPSALLPVFRILHLTEEDLVSLHKKIQEEKKEPKENEEKAAIAVPGVPDAKVSALDIVELVKKGPISEANEQLATQSLLTKLQTMLQGFPTTIDEDVQILKEKSDLTFHGRLSVALRLSEKRLLETSIKQLQGEAPSTDKKKKKKKKKKPANNNNNNETVPANTEQSEK